METSSSRLEELSSGNRWSNRAVFETVRLNSDDIRQTTIPQLIQDGTKAKDSFYELHKAASRRNPYAANIFPPQVNQEGNDFVRSIPDDEYYRGADPLKAILEKTGQRRTTRLSTPHALHLEPENLEAVENLLMEGVDALSAGNEVEFLRKLTLIQATLQLAHLPTDISGRTTEDFIVWLSQKHGFPISISANGYRGYPDNILVQSVADSQTKLYENLLFDCDQQMDKPTFKDPAEVTVNRNLQYFIWDKWLNQRERKGKYIWQQPAHSDPKSRTFEAYLVTTAKEFARAIRNPSKTAELLSKYPALNDLYRILLEGRQNTYRVLSDQTGKIADGTMNCLAFTPIAAEHWNPDYVPAYHQLTGQLATGIEWLEQNSETVLAEQIKARANKVLGNKTTF